MTFHEWRTMWMLCKQNDITLRTMSFTEFYSNLTAKFTSRKDFVSAEACWAEHELLRLGRPYYKIWPEMVASLSYVKLDIPGKFLEVPYEIYEIRLPVAPPMREEQNSPALQSLLVQKLDSTTGRRMTDNGPVTVNDERISTLCVRYQFSNDARSLECTEEEGCGWYFSVPIHAERTIEDTLLQTWDETGGHVNEHGATYVPGFEMARAIIRIAVSAAFFGTGRHELVRPDIPRKSLERWRKAKEEGDEPEQHRILQKAKEVGLGGKIIATEVDLPEPRIVYKGDSPSDREKRELKHGHVRRAHMRMQPYGPQGNPNRYELRFVRQAVVRPDLPFLEQHGFRIRQPQ